MTATKFSIPMNQDQINNILSYIDASQDEAVKAAVFTRLGHECFSCRHSDRWIDSFDGDVQKFLDNVNVEHKSTFWESLLFSADKRQLILTGKEVDGCACSYAASSTPPISLCHYCCKRFQEVLFAYLLGKQVKVTITESYLLGNTRCSTLIDIIE